MEATREASRRLVRRLGFMEDALARSGLPASSVHALIEIERLAGCTARKLTDELCLDKSSVSRLLRKLLDRGLVATASRDGDGRTKMLSLTPQGGAMVAAIHDFARRQVAEALARLAPHQRDTVIEGLGLYADALAVDGASQRATSQITIERGYRPGTLARCAEMHASYYARAAGFGRSFEALVASGLAAFAERLDRSCNGLWAALKGERVVGTVVIDGEDLGSGLGHLRWFIVDDEARGQGAGRALLAEAIAFCDRQGFGETHLWTFRGLDAARHLYEAHGFVLAEERVGAQWGVEVMEQRFVRPHGGRP